MIAWLFISVLHAASLQSTLRNHRGSELLKQDRAFEATQSLIEALSRAPFQPEIQLNLGLAFEKQKEPDKALAQYLSVYNSSADDQLKFAAAFNAARILGEQKKLSLALEHYQKALALNPQSQEAKTNIELLMRDSAGGGGGDSQNQQKKGDEKDKDPKDAKDPKDEGKQKGDQPKPDDKESKKPAKPKEFKSENMSQSDVRKILEELKNQEQKIRGKEYDKKGKEAPHGKDW